MSAEIILASMEIGVLVSSVIYGVTCLQCYLYFAEHSKNDPIHLKILVSVLMLLETFHTALIGHALYTYTVKAFGEIDKLTEATWSILLQINISSISSTITQFFFARRIYHLNGQCLTIPLIICFLSMIQLVLAIYFVAEGFIAPSSPYSRSSVLPIIGSTIELVTALCDSVITTSTIYCLRNQNSRFPLASTTRVINRMIKYTLNTGLATTVFALITAATVMTSSNTLIYIPFYFILTRLYMCSLVSILNSRSAVQREFNRGSNTRTGSNRNTTTIGLNLSRATYTTTDDTSEQFFGRYQLGSDSLKPRLQSTS